MLSEIVPDSELLAMACEFDMGPPPLATPSGHHVYVKNMGSDRWAILFHFDCLNKNGLWEWQPLNSHRNDEFFARCRYSSVHEAIRYYQRWKEVILQWASEQIASGVKNLNYEDCPSDLRHF